MSKPTLESLGEAHSHKLQDMTRALEAMRSDLTEIVVQHPGQYRLRSFLTSISMAADDSNLAQIELNLNMDATR